MTNKLLSLWLVFILLPIFFMRVIDDEAVYYCNIKKYILNPGIPYRSQLSILILGIPLRIYDSIISIRVVNALIVLATALIIKRMRNEQAAIIFLFTFSTLRWGARVNYEPLATLFFILSMNYLREDRLAEATALMLMASLSRTTFLPLLIYLILLWIIRSESRAIHLIAVPLVIVALYLSKYVIRVYLPASLSNITRAEFYPITIRNLLEYFITSPLLILSLRNMKETSRQERILFLLLLLSIIMIPAFTYNGPFERYTIPLTAMLSLYFPRINRKQFAIIIALQFIILNLGVLYLSTSGANSIYDFGYRYNRQIIDILRQIPENETITGFHGGLVRQKNWHWCDRNITCYEQGDWIVIYQSWITGEIRGAETMKIGRYLIIHKTSPNFTLPARCRTLWRFREDRRELVTG